MPIKKNTPVKLSRIKYNFSYGDAVLVSWIDIHNDESGWKEKGDVKMVRCAVQTLGWWIADDEQQIILCADLITEDGATNTRMIFPKGCIESIRRVNCG